MSNDMEKALFKANIFNDNKHMYSILVEFVASLLSVEVDFCKHPRKPL